jgi:hypothetical protein
VARHAGGERIVRHRCSAGQFFEMGHDRIFLRGGRTARVACMQASGVWPDSRVRVGARGTVRMRQQAHSFCVRSAVTRTCANRWLPF